ncbi:hypothetical protein EVA_12037 [gut metagenome]|uniref:Uncharacterized protein n=1 Tax=gut metagenome TaxID=749906 RepID=J9FXZ7_9ZZZZ
MAHGDIAVVAAQLHLCAFCDDVACAVNSGIDGSLRPTIADGFDFLNGVRNFHQP